MSNHNVFALWVYGGCLNYVCYDLKLCNREWPDCFKSLVFAMNQLSFELAWQLCIILAPQSKFAKEISGSVAELHINRMANNEVVDISEV